MLTHSLLPLLPSLRDGRPSLQLLIPGPTSRISRLPFLGDIPNVSIQTQHLKRSVTTHLLKPISHNRRTEPIPRHKRQIRIRTLVPHQPLPSTLLQMRIDHTRHAPDLIAVSVQDGFEVLLRVVEDEPGALAEVRTFLDVSKVCETRVLSSTAYLGPRSGSAAKTA